MVQCSKCGHSLADEMKYCPQCGAVNKALHPGEAGSEGGRPLPASLQAFIAELEDYERLIAEEKKGHQEGAGEKKKIIVLPQEKTVLTLGERRKAALIQNYAFQNDEETILEALLFVKSRVSLLTLEKKDKRTAYWAQLWMARAEEFYERGRALLPAEARVQKAYDEILRDGRKVEAVVKRRDIVREMICVLALLAVVFMSFAAFFSKTDLFGWPSSKKGNVSAAVSPEESSKDFADSSSGRKETQEEEETEDNHSPSDPTGDGDSKPSRPYSDSRTVNIENYTFTLPSYWDEGGSREDYYQFYAEKGGKVAMISISDGPGNEGEVTLDALYKDNEGMIEAIETWFSDCKVTDSEKFQSEFGVEGMLYSYIATWRQEDKTYNLTGKCLCFLSPKDRRWFFVALNATDNTTYDYSGDFMKILADIREMGDNGTAAGDGKETEDSRAAKADEKKSDQTTEPQKIFLVDSGWCTYRKGEYAHVPFAVQIKNPNANLAAKYPTVTVTAKSSDGKILSTEERVLNSIAADDTILYGSEILYEGEEPSTVEISVSNKESNFTRQDDSRFVRQNSFVITNISENPGMFKNYTGEITNNSSVDFSIVAVTMIYRKDGKIIGGGVEYVSDLSAGETKAFKLSADSEMTQYDSCEFYAVQW